MPTVRVTCPDCEHSFNISDARVGGLVPCRDCGTEFRVEFAEDEPAEPDSPRPAAPDRKPPPRTRSRPDADSEPDTWKTDLPLRSPLPLLGTLVGLQVLAAFFLVAHWFFPIGEAPPTSIPGYYTSPTKKAPTTPTAKW